MASSHKFSPAVVVLLLLVVGIEVASAQTVRECEAESAKFAGLCMVGTNCANVCLTEGFTSGKCSGLKRKCVCTKPC